MRKDQEIADPNSCFNRANMDTRMFVLLDWDPATPATARAWAKERIARGLNQPEDRQIKEALAYADAVERDLPKVRSARAAARSTSLNPAAAWPFPGGMRP